MGVVPTLRTDGEGNGLFSDAEAGEDGGEDFVGGDLSGDGAEVVEGVAEVYGEEVGREVVIESL